MRRPGRLRALWRNESLGAIRNRQIRPYEVLLLVPPSFRRLHEQIEVDAVGNARRADPHGLSNDTLRGWREKEVREDMTDRDRRLVRAGCHVEAVVGPLNLEPAASERGD